MIDLFKGVRPRRVYLKKSFAYKRESFIEDFIRDLHYLKYLKRCAKFEEKTKKIFFLFLSIF